MCTKHGLFVALCVIGLTSPHALGGEMDGAWVSISRVKAGVQQLSSQSQAVIDNSTFFVVREGERTELGKITESSTESTNLYTVKMKGDVPLTGQEFHGIFRICGDTMFTCVNPNSGQKAPANFSSTKENKNVLIVWMRKSAYSKSKFVELENTHSDEAGTATGERQ